jgi:hypothetical protein
MLLIMGRSCVRKRKKMCTTEITCSFFDSIEESTDINTANMLAYSTHA